MKPRHQGGGKEEETCRDHNTANNRGRQNTYSSSWSSRFLAQWGRFCFRLLIIKEEHSLIFQDLIEILIARDRRHKLRAMSKNSCKFDSPPSVLIPHIERTIDTIMTLLSCWGMVTITNMNTNIDTITNTNTNYCETIQTTGRLGNYDDYKYKYKYKYK